MIHDSITIPDWSDFHHESRTDFFVVDSNGSRFKLGFTFLIFGHICDQMSQNKASRRFMREFGWITGIGMKSGIIKLITPCCCQWLFYLDSLDS